MEHATITLLKNDYYRIVPDEGYVLYDVRTDKYYTEAITKNIYKFNVIIKP